MCRYSTRKEWSDHYATMGGRIYIYVCVGDVALTISFHFVLSVALGQVWSALFRQTGYDELRTDCFCCPSS